MGSLVINKETNMNNITNEFPGLNAEIDGEPVLYLDSAATSLKPKVMIDAISRYYSGVACNVHRGKHFAMEEVSNQYEQVRYNVANLIQCHGNEVVFVSNTTEAINMVASGLELQKDDLVLVSENAHHSNLLPWSSKAKTEIIVSLPNGAIDIEQYERLLQQKPKVVALTHCSNVTGIYIDLERMAALAKSVGAIVLVDAAQSIPHRKVSVKSGNIDFMCFSAHKMLGPNGVGVLYGKADMLESLVPQTLGGGMVDWVEYDSFRLRKIPHRFEAGTPNIAGVIGFGASIDYLNRVGIDVISEHDRRLGHFILKEAKKRDYIKVICDDESLDRGAVLSFAIRGLDDLDDVSRYLSDSYGIIVRNGHLCAQPYTQSQTDGQVLRVSGYIYNSEEDIKTFFSALDEICTSMLNISSVSA
ncbi:aminotransferase class V-fold PLP-dependent enzyme [Pseudoalteromonas maricaloris]|nr:hypothetical protein [Pseudoalteromonas flavipulchra NCIMB 2033 = ATCC BAA-314]